VYKQGGRTPLKWRKPLGPTFFRRKMAFLLKNKEFCKEKRISAISTPQFQYSFPLRYHIADMNSKRGGLVQPFLFRIIFVPILLIHDNKEFGSFNIRKLLLSYQRLL